jgi:hypothetical protein
MIFGEALASISRPEYRDGGNTRIWTQTCDQGSIDVIATRADGVLPEGVLINCQGPTLEGAGLRDLSTTEAMGLASKLADAALFARGGS